MALPTKTWVIIDEVQKLPALLDEVQAILFSRPKQIQFALTGSSARKLKRGGANLLAGRVIRTVPKYERPKCFTAPAISTR